MDCIKCLAFGCFMMTDCGSSRFFPNNEREIEYANAIIYKPLPSIDLDAKPTLKGDFRDYTDKELETALHIKAQRDVYLSTLWSNIADVQIKASNKNKLCLLVFNESENQNIKAMKEKTHDRECGWMDNIGFGLYKSVSRYQTFPMSMVSNGRALIRKQMRIYHEVKVIKQVQNNRDLKQLNERLTMLVALPRRTYTDCKIKFYGYSYVLSDLLETVQVPKGIILK